MEIGEGVIDYTQAQVNVSSNGSATIHSFFVRKFMGRPLILRPGSKHLPALDMLSAVATTVGREVHVFVSPATLPSPDEGSSTGPQTDNEPDDFYEFTAADYAQTIAHKKQDVFLKTRKIREEEEAARRSRVTKACVRVQFPDNFVLEAVFQPSDPLSLVIELLQKVILQPDLAFYLYTTPPKQRIKDLQQSMYAAGLTPGALVYFSYEAVKGQEGNSEGPFLRPEIAALRDLHLLENSFVQHEPISQGIDLTSVSNEADLVPERKDTKRSSGKPKWFKQR